MKKSAVIAVLFVLFVSLFYFFRTTVDPDLWGHLQFGRDIYESASIPKFDTYSYSAQGMPSINHEWLAELILYLIFAHFSALGLILFKFSVAFALSLLLYGEIKNSIQSRLLRVAVLLGTVSAVSYGFAVRTQIFTYLFFAVVLIALKRREDGIRSNTLLFSLPPIFLFWCNLHGGFVAALGVMAVYTVYKLSSRIFDRNLIFVMSLSLLATLANPYGIDLWKFLLRSMTQTPLLLIDEWNRVSLSPTFISYFLLLAFSGIVLLKKRLTLFEYVLVISGICFSLAVNRHTVLFAIIFAVFLARHIGDLFDEIFLRIESRLSNNFFRFGYLLCSLFFLWGAFFSLQSNPLKILVPSKDYPVDAVEFLKVNGIHGNIFPWFDWGLMCVGEMAGKSKVFFDGRFGIIYKDRFIKEYFEIINADLDYKSYLSKFPETDIFLLNKSNPLSISLSADKEHILVFSSDLTSIYLRKNKRNEGVLKKFNEQQLVYPDFKEPIYFEKMPR